MINIKDKIYESLSQSLDNVTDIYPSSWAELPAIQYTEEENNVYEVADSQEASSYLRYRIDIWDNNSTSATAVKVDEVMSEFGFRRIACGDVTDPTGLRHKQMRYEAVVDIDNEFIYYKD